METWSTFVYRLKQHSSLLRSIHMRPKIVIMYAHFEPSVTKTHGKIQYRLYAESKK